MLHHFLHTIRYQKAASVVAVQAPTVTPKSFGALITTPTASKVHWTQWRNRKLSQFHHLHGFRVSPWWTEPPALRASASCGWKSSRRSHWSASISSSQSGRSGQKMTSRRTYSRLRMFYLRIHPTGRLTAVVQWPICVLSLCRDLCGEKQTTGALLTKHARSSLLNGVKVFNSRRPLATWACPLGLYLTVLSQLTFLSGGNQCTDL